MSFDDDASEEEVEEAIADLELGQYLQFLREADEKGISLAEFMRERIRAEDAARFEHFDAHMHSCAEGMKEVSTLRALELAYYEILRDMGPAERTPFEEEEFRRIATDLGLPPAS